MNAEPETLYQFKIHLLDISPIIWRRFIVGADTTIAELHYIVQLVMGWQDTHLNCFKIYGKDYGVANPTCRKFERSGKCAAPVVATTQ